MEGLDFIDLRPFPAINSMGIGIFGNDEFPVKPQLKGRVNVFVQKNKKTSQRILKEKWLRNITEEWKLKEFNSLASGHHEVIVKVQKVFIGSVKVGVLRRVSTKK